MLRLWFRLVPLSIHLPLFSSRDVFAKFLFIWLWVSRTDTSRLKKPIVRARLPVSPIALLRSQQAGQAGIEPISRWRTHYISAVCWEFIVLQPGTVKIKMLRHKTPDCPALPVASFSCLKVGGSDGPQPFKRTSPRSSPVMEWCNRAVETNKE